MFSPRPRLRRLAAWSVVPALTAGLLAAVVTGAPPASARTLPWVVRIVAGSHSMRDALSRTWTSDSAYARGGHLVGTRRHVAGTRAPWLYRTARAGVFSYRVQVQPGSYAVVVNLADYRFHSPGERVFAVAANGRTVVKRVDPAGAVGLLRAYHVRFVSDAPRGVLVLRFVHRRGNPIVSSVQLVRRGGPLRAPRPKPAPGPPTTPPSTPPPAAPPAGSAPVSTYVTPEQFGATGDGSTDDTIALQRAFDAASSTTGVWLAPGRVYVHSRLLDIRVRGEHVTGGGTLLATNENASSVWADADNVVLDGITVAIASTTRRGETWDQMGVRIVGHSGVVLRQVVVDGSAAAGIYIGNAAADFLLDHVTVRNTRADGIHMTGGAHNGTVLAPTVIGSGDDGVAVVSYGQDGTPCHDITVRSPVVRDQTWGRGLSVVGGTDITETNIDVRNSDAAAVYIGTEGDPWNTAAVNNVSISGGSITNANTRTTIDHGAVFVLAGRSGYVSHNITVSNVSISNTRSTASRDLGVVTYGSSPPVGVLFADITVTGGPHSAYSGNTAQSSYRLRSITQNGIRLPDAG